MKTPRDRAVAVLGTLVGLLLLGLVVVFAVVLPKVSADAGAGGGTLGEVELPDELPGGLRALDLGAEGIPEDQLASIIANAEYAGEALDEIVEGGGDARQYVNEDLTSAPIVQVYGAESGPLVPEQLVDPEAFDLSRPPFEVVTEGEVSCEVEWTEIDQATQQPLPEPQIVSTTCQRTAEGLTVKLLNGGNDLEASVAAVDEVWELNA